MNKWLFDYRKMSIRGILALLAGCVAVFVPEITMKTIVMAIGGFIFLGGIINILISYLGKKGKLSKVEISGSLLNLIFGLILIIMPSLFVKVIVVIIGIALLFIGIIQLVGTINLRAIIGWSWINFILSILILISGVVLLSNPFESAEAILTFFGIILIVFGISELIMSWKLHNSKDKYKGTDVHDIGYEEH